MGLASVPSPMSFSTWRLHRSCSSLWWYSLLIAQSKHYLALWHNRTDNVQLSIGSPSFIIFWCPTFSWSASPRSHLCTTSCPYTRSGFLPQEIWPYFRTSGIITKTLLLRQRPPLAASAWLKYLAHISEQLIIQPEICCRALTFSELYSSPWKSPCHL